MTVEWVSFDLDGDPILVVLVRGTARRLGGRRVPIDQNVYDELRGVAKAAIERVASMKRVDYSPYVGLDEGEYLGLEREAIVAKARPKRKQSTDGEDANEASIGDETVAILEAVDAADYLEAMGAAAIGDVPPESFAGQVICFGTDDARIGFVTRANPRKILKRSLIPLGKADDSDRLKRVTKPELVLEPTIHAIVTNDEVAVLNPTQFQFLVADATLLADHVPAQVRVIEAAFTARGMKVAQPTLDALTARAQQQPRLARRLDAFADRVGQIDLEALSTGEGFKTQELEASDFMDSTGAIACAPDRLPELLDALEGRFFKDAFSAEERRADRFRRRT
jgi:hypothetical protein